MTARTLDDLAQELTLAYALVTELEKALIGRNCGLGSAHTKLLSALENAGTYLEDALATVGKALREERESAPRSADVIAWERQTRAPIGKPVTGGF